MTPILGEAQVTKAKAVIWARKQGADPAFIANAEWYWRYASERGVRPEVAYAQHAHETAFCHFGGVIDATFKNPAGLKLHGGGGNFDPNAHTRFPTWACGIVAHLDHLALYAGAPGYPRPGTTDPRHFPTLLGTAPTVEALGAKWAPDPAYGRAVLAKLDALLAA